MYYHAKYIIPGILVFLVLAFTPVLYNLGKNYDVKPELPRDYKECVESTQFMRDNHMKLLKQWRYEAVREGKRIYVNAKGKKYVKSLTNTCLGCHTDKTKFCDRCHNTVGVNPYCWDCHNTSPDQKTPIPLAASGETGGH